MKNFPFQYNGQEYWYSRAMCCVSAVFCTNRDYELCVLVNRRGTATTQENHKWNLPVGYLDFDETLKDCAIREVFEETGVKVPANTISLYNINSKPDSGKQDVGFRYVAKLPGFIEKYPLSTANMEDNEVESVMWLPVSKIDTITWAWNHRKITVDILKKKFNIDYKTVNEDKEFCYTFKCTDGVKVDVFGNCHCYGHTDYWDCATYDKKCEDTAENNFIKAYKDIINRHPGIKPIRTDAILLDLIKKANMK